MKKIYNISIFILLLFFIFLFNSANNKTIDYKNYAIDLSNYNNLTNEEITFIKDKFNLILVNKFNQNLSEKKQILVYNLLFMDNEKNTNNNILEEDCYAHAVVSPLKNNRIKNKYNNKFLMNIFSEKYINFILSDIKSKIDQYNFSGILFEDVDFNLGNYIDYVPQGYNKEKYTKQILKILNKIKTDTKIPNILISGVYENLSSYIQTNFFNNLNYGGITKKFIYSIFNIYNTSNEKIYIKFLNLVNNFSKNKPYIAFNKLNGIYSNKLTTEERLYSFTSYLLIYNPNIYYLIQDLSLNTPVQYFPEMDIDLGKPIDNFTDITFYFDKFLQIYKREFEKGIILVNPYPFSKIVTLDKYYTNLKFNGLYKNGKDENIIITKIKAKQITIPSYSGTILLKSTNTDSSK